MKPATIRNRKDDHIRINLEEEVTSGITSGFERFSFEHQALPEIDLEKISTNCNFLSNSLSIPLMISSMTGGTRAGDLINLRLAEAAQFFNIAMGVGSQRVALEHAEVSGFVGIRQKAPTVPLFANLGAVQLNYGLTIKECIQVVEMIDANGLILHLNPLQEALQTDGQTNFAELIRKIEEVCRNIAVPVIVKEVGWGLSGSTAKKLVEAGVSVIDIAGAGGTSWSEVEMHRSSSVAMARISSQFRNWGIPTARSLLEVRSVLPHVPIIASGGIKRGMEIAKSIALGANICGMAGILLKAANNSTESVLDILNEIKKELVITMFAAGVSDIPALAKLTLVDHFLERQ